MKKLFKLVLFILLIFLITGCENKYELNDDETMAWLKLRLAITESELHSSSETFTIKYFTDLKKVAKKYDKNSEWFSSDYKTVYFGKESDTEKYQIDSICDGNYCATFKVEYKDKKYYLVDYKFEQSSYSENTIYVKFKPN